MKTLLLLAISLSAHAAAGWTELTNTTLNTGGVCPGGTSGTCGNVIEAWSGGALDALRGRLLLFGGGHGDYNGNEVYAIYPPGTTPQGVVCSSATAPAICRIKDPSASLRSIVGACALDAPNGTDPNSRHTYDGLAYIAHRDKLMTVSGSVTSGNGCFYGDTWTLPLTGLTWEAKDATTNVISGGGNIFPRQICSGSLGCTFTGQGPWVNTAYDPVTQDVFVQVGLADNLWRYTEATNTYTSVKNGLTMPTNASWVIDPRRRRIYTFGNTDGPFGGDATTSLGTPLITYIDISSGGSYAQTTVSATGCDGLSAALNPGVDYDPVLDRIVGWPNFGNIVYIFNPDTATCTTQTHSGGPPDSLDGSSNVRTNGTFGRFRYLPALNAYIVTNDSNTNAYLLRLSGSNNLTIKNTGATTSNYPVQIGRAFAEGEIPSGSLPRASVDGTPVDTQVDVKARWSDNSLKHAIVSFLVPTFTSGATYTASLAAGTTVGNTALTQGQMLDAAYNFDAVISLTETGVTKTASARTMLTNGDYTVWASGPIATTVLLGNHAQGTTCGGAAASTYDFGFTSFCAFRPLFEATFWAGINKVYVRYIGEISNTEQLEDVVTDSMSLTAGNSSPAAVYTRATALTMHAGSRWTKTAWIGTAPPVAAYNHNLAYLAYAKALPNYDTTKTIAEATLSANYTDWGAASKDLYDFGLWDTPLGGGGGHPHVGPYPAWVVQWLYSGDYRAQEEALGQAELLTTVEWHLREGKAGKKLDRAGAVDGIGYPVSISTRPTLNLYDLTVGATAGDLVVPVGTVTNNGWDSGTDFTYWGSIISHPPETFFPLYLVTGEHFYLEEGQFQASFMAGVLGGNTTGDWRSRGPTGAEGGIVDRASQRFQTRGQGWAFRSRAEIAWATPDASAFKTYLEVLIADNLAYWEGQRNITTTAYNGNTMWTFGRATATTDAGLGTQWDSWEGPDGVITTPSPLHFWDNGNSGICDGVVNDTAVAKDCNSPWMEDYVLYALGRAAELGYSATALRDWLGENTIGALTNAGFNPWMAGAYRSAIIDQSGSAYFATWADSKTGFLSAVRTEVDWYPGTVFAGTESNSDGNVQPLVTAVSMVAGQTDGVEAWRFVAPVIPDITEDPKWAILPRIITASVSSSAAGGVRSGGKVTVRGKVIR
jgi:hypothetical protein